MLRVIPSSPAEDGCWADGASAWSAPASYMAEPDAPASVGPVDAQPANEFELRGEEGSSLLCLQRAVLMARCRHCPQLNEPLIPVSPGERKRITSLCFRPLSARDFAGSGAHGLPDLDHSTLAQSILAKSGWYP